MNDGAEITAISMSVNDPAVFREITAMARIAEAADGLEADSRARVLNWVGALLADLERRPEPLAKWERDLIEKQGRDELIQEVLKDIRTELDMSSYHDKAGVLEGKIRETLNRLEEG